jgi:hypothetical protein
VSPRRALTPSVTDSASSCRDAGARALVQGRKLKLKASFESKLSKRFIISWLEELKSGVVNMGPTWGQPGINLGSTWGHPGVDLRSAWGQPGVNLGSSWGQAGVKWGQPGVKLGSRCGQAGVSLGSSWGQAGVKQHRPTLARSASTKARSGARMDGTKWLCRTGS